MITLRYVAISEISAYVMTNSICNIYYIHIVIYDIQGFPKECVDISNNCKLRVYSDSFNFQDVIEFTNFILLFCHHQFSD